VFHLGGRGRRGNDSLFEYICVFDVGKSIISTRGLVTTDAFLFSFFLKKISKFFGEKCLCQRNYHFDCFLKKSLILGSKVPPGGLVAL
jgi:hypothetical protein